MSDPTSTKYESDWLHDARPVVLGAFVAYCAVLVTYFAAFWNAGCCDQGAWGQFGDFVGGVFNPVLGLASVFLLAQTLKEQRRLMRETRNQIVVEELQRLLTATSKGLDEALAGAIDSNHPNLWHVFQPSGVVVPRRQAGSLPTSESRCLLDVVRQVYVRFRQEELGIAAFSTSVNAPELVEVFRGLMRLDECLQEFLRLGGNPVIGRLYGSQYAEPALLLSGAISAEEFSSGDIRLPPGALERLGLQGRTHEMDRGLERCRQELSATLTALASQDPGVA